jgi:hypothetical protein
MVVAALCQQQVSADLRSRPIVAVVAAATRQLPALRISFA